MGKGKGSMLPPRPYMAPRFPTALTTRMAVATAHLSVYLIALRAYGVRKQARVTCWPALVRSLIPSV